jgi:hypothetical protein
MIRIDEIYTNLFGPMIKRHDQSIHYFDPFGRTDKDALMVDPLIIDRNKALLCWDQEPFFPSVHMDTIHWFIETFTKNNNKCDVIFLTSEKDSIDVKQLCEKMGFRSSYYFFHAWASLDWYRGYDKSLLIPNYKDREITNTFISPNRIVGGYREHRIELFRKMVKYDIVKNNVISFPKYCPYSKEEIVINGINLPLVFEGEDPDNIPNESYKITLWDKAKNSLLYVITETLYSQDTLHLTEKTFKPIVMQMPFVLVGPKGSLEYLRSYGFKTFNEFWDESYDTLDNDKRINAIIELLKELDNLSTNEKIELQKNISKVVEHNFNWFYSKEFENLLWCELQDTMSKW